MVEKLQCMFQERCFMGFRKVQKLLFVFQNWFGIAVWFAGLAYKPLFCSTVGLELLWVPRLV